MSIALGANVGFNFLATVGVFKVRAEKPLVNHKVRTEIDTPRLLRKAESFKSGEAIFLTGNAHPQTGICIVAHFS